ncbi:MAG: hypothetical protein ACYC96_16550, partial [Fimbriimonadaceae bacterium]
MELLNLNGISQLYADEPFSRRELPQRVSRPGTGHYDGVFNLTGFSTSYGTGGTLPNGNRTFGYDSKDRLTSSSIPTSNTTTFSSTFGFDSSGNRSSVNGTSVPFNADNQFSAPGNWFDGNGNPGSYG